jgi:hypothetical protein
MTDEMEDVNLVVLVNGLIELLEGSPIQPFQAHQPFVAQRRQRRGQLCFLLLDVQRGEAVGGADQPEHTQREAEGIRGGNLAEIERASHRAIYGLGEEARLLVEILPGKVHQLGGVGEA